MSTPIDIATLVSEGTCYTCFAPQPIPGIAELALWSRISQASSSPLGGPITIDDMESYTAGTDLSVCNGGSNWLQAYVSRSSFWTAIDSMETYTVGASLSGLNDGSGWDSGYASRP
jgi:hypothetical protein